MGVNTPLCIGHDPRRESLVVCAKIVACSDAFGKIPSFLSIGVRLEDRTIHELPELGES